LLCWHGDKKNTYTQEFKSKQGVTYEIRAKNDREKLTEARVKVAWVYKSSRKSTSSWRLF
jgi:acyl-CoA thioesterase FadM